MLLIVSIVLEAAVAVLAFLAASRRGNPYIYGLSFTFAVYVFYDLARYLHWDVQQGVLSVLFLLATVSALVAVWGLYKR
jgi:hypothetical protein